MKKIITLTLCTILAYSLASASFAQQRNLWASGTSFKGIWPVMRNGIIDGGFKNGLRVRYQAGEGSEASERFLETIMQSSNNPTSQMPAGLLLTAAPYSLRAQIERHVRQSRIPIVLIGADTGSKSQPKDVLAIVGMDAFEMGKRAGAHAKKQAAMRTLTTSDKPSLCLRTRSDDPARARICSGIAAALGRPIAMLTIVQGRKGKHTNNKETGENSIDSKRLRSYLRKNPSTPLIWLDDGALTQEVISASADLTQAPLAIFGLAGSQKSIIEKTPEKIAFIIDQRPFQQGRRAVSILRSYLKLSGEQNYSSQKITTQTISLTPRILGIDELNKILPDIGRTR